MPTPDREDPPEAPRRSALAGRLLRVMFACYLAVAVLLTGVQMAVEYRFARDRLTGDVEALQRTFSPGIEDAMWRFNVEVLEGILAGMTQIPAVVGVEVRDERGARLQALGTIADDAGHGWRVGPDGSLSPAALGFGTPFSRTFDLVHTDENGVRHPVGSWTVHSNDGLAIAQVRNTLTVIVINSAIKSAMLWLIFSLVIRRMVGRPLARMGAFVREIDAGALEADRAGPEPLAVEPGGPHELHALATTLNTMAGRLRGAFADNAVLLRDLRGMNATLQARVAERTKELEHLAATDLLTGLVNRRKLDETLERAAMQARRDGSALAVILGDVDHFKSINDRHGHRIGDVALVAFAEALREGVRPADTVGRWGGEEFLIVCPGTDLPTAAALAERLRQRIAATPLPVVGARTCSFGVAALLPGEAPDALLARADAALYRCKRNGRNRVEQGHAAPADDGKAA
jgi:diguanylate cyclase (GGDEF)-like protein